MNVIETAELTKTFGATLAVDHLSLNVQQGAVFGFLGPNGAGKTTTLRMLVGLAHPDGGDAMVLGESIRDGRQSYLSKIGFLPDVPGFYSWMRPGEYLTLVGQIFKIPARELPARVAEMLETTGLQGVKGRIGSFSRGMKQRLGLAQALLNKPELLFLDEPTSALDPIGRKEILDTIAGLAGQTTVLFSTHILSDVERVCDKVAILDQGRLLAEQSIVKLREKYAFHFIYLELEGQPDFTALAQGLPWIEQVDAYRSGWRLQASDLAAAQYQLPKLITEHNLTLRHFELLEPSLEDIFMKVVQDQ